MCCRCLSKLICWLLSLAGVLILLAILLIVVVVLVAFSGTSVLDDLINYVVECFVDGDASAYCDDNSNIAKYISNHIAESYTGECTMTNFPPEAGAASYTTVVKYGVDLACMENATLGVRLHSTGGGTPTLAARLVEAYDGGERAVGELDFIDDAAERLFAYASEYDALAFTYGGELSFLSDENVAAVAASSDVATEIDHVTFDVRLQVSGLPAFLALRLEGALDVGAVQDALERWLGYISSDMAREVSRALFENTYSLPYSDERCVFSRAFEPRAD